MSTTEDDIRAAMTSVAESESAPLPVEQPAPVGQNRDDHGRFAAASPAAPEAAPAPGTGGSPTPPASGAPEAAPAAPEAPAAPTPAPAGGPALFDPAKPPSGWTAEMKAKWDAIPEDVRKEVIRREEASHLGFEKFRKQVEPAQQVFDVVNQHADYFQHLQRDPVDYVSEMISTERTLATGNPTQKLETLLDIADGYGVPLRQVLDAAMQGGLAAAIAEGHKVHNTPPAIPHHVQRELNELRRAQQTQVQAGFAAELQTMESDKANFPLFEEAREAMAAVIEKGMATNFKDAYETAVWTNPELRQRAIALANGQSAVTAAATRQAAAGGLAAPRPAPVVSATPPADQNTNTEDDIRAAFAKLSGGNRA